MTSVTFFTRIDDLARAPCRIRPRAWSPRSTLPTESLNQGLDLLGGLGTARGEIPHLRGDHRKAAALLAGASRLHRRVERQQVRLEGDLVDDADDVGDALRRGIDLAHRARPPRRPPRRPARPARAPRWRADWPAPRCPRCSSPSRSSPPSRRRSPPDSRLAPRFAGSSPRCRARSPRHPCAPRLPPEPCCAPRRPYSPAAGSSRPREP